MVVMRFGSMMYIAASHKMQMVGSVGLRPISIGSVSKMRVQMRQRLLWNWSATVPAEGLAAGVWPVEAEDAVCALLFGVDVAFTARAFGSGLDGLGGGIIWHGQCPR